MEPTKQHWENVYATKQPQETSWYQPEKTVSIEMIRSLNLPKSAAMVDVGGGDGQLVDELLADGFENLTVVDISGQALERAKMRLGEKAQKIVWEETDMLRWLPAQPFDLWHDRAAFHFLTEESDQEAYAVLAADSIKTGGYLVIGAFSTDGPKKCSGLPITQHSEASLRRLFESNFKLRNCHYLIHNTPFNTEQRFIFCIFVKESAENPIFPFFP